MLIILPIGTNSPLTRKPQVNYVLIALNFAVFLAPNILKHAGLMDSVSAKRMLESWVLFSQKPQLHQFFTYAFLHAGWMHILGNMFFLYVFGNSVNSKLGNLGYLLLYLGGAVFSGLGHTLLLGKPVLGASGAVAAITGTYMVLFPKTLIHTFYWFLFFVGTTDFSALYFILFKLIIYDNMLEPRWADAPGNVAYSAHLAGYCYGILVPMILLALKILPHSQFDLWALFQRWRRRQQFQTMGGFGPRYVESTSTDVPPVPQSPAADLRNQISGKLYESRLDEAADLYLQLMQTAPDQVLPQQQQLDVANKLMHTGRHHAAAKAYEDFIRYYPRYPFLEQVQLMLGLLYSRYLGQKDLAKKHLQKSLEKLTDAGQRQMCQNELDHLQG